MTMTVADFEDVWLDAKDELDEIVEEFEREFFQPFVETQAAMMYDELDDAGKQKLLENLLASSPEVQEQFKQETPSVWAQLEERQDA